MKMSVSTLAVAAALTAATPAFAHDDLFTSVTNNVFTPNVFRGMGTGFSQDFESFAVGPLVPQGGWESQFPNNATITEINPLSGARSARHASDGTSVPGFEINSPEFAAGYDTNVTAHRIAANIRISGGTSTYQLVTRDLSIGTLNTRVSFDTDGRVRVGQYSVDPFEGEMFEFIDTGFDWMVDTSYEVEIETDDAGNLFVSVNGAEIFAGLEGTFGIFGVPGSINQFLIYAGNEGAGAADASGDTLTLDDVSFTQIPTPATAALLGLAGVATARRRR